MYIEYRIHENRVQVRHDPYSDNWYDVSYEDLTRMYIELKNQNELLLKRTASYPSQDYDREVDHV